MKTEMDSTDKYYYATFNKLLHIAPLAAFGAVITFTFARLMGYYSFVSISSIIGFDIICSSYFLWAYLVKRRGIVGSDGNIDEKRMFRAELLLVSVGVVQWNMITYIFPTRDFWGFAPLFVLISGFLFHARVVCIAIFGISSSIAVSWYLLGSQLLPVQNDMFVENLILRIVTLIVSFTVIYMLVYFAEQFTKIVKENYKEMKKQNETLRSMSRDIIEFTADIVEKRDTTSGSHAKRLKTWVSILAWQIAEDFPEYGLDAEKIALIAFASALHDVGKIGIPDSILLKKGRLTSEEFEIMKTHTGIGVSMIEGLPASVGEECKRYCGEICKYHHEKYDGSGYPYGLKGEEIPISAQIVSAMDCFDALTSERPYKNAFSPETALEMILNGECGAFSEKIQKSLRSCSQKLIESRSTFE